MCGGYRFVVIVEDIYAIHVIQLVQKQGLGFEFGTAVLTAKQETSLSCFVLLR